jgi:hypothetical protein
MTTASDVHGAWGQSIRDRLGIPEGAAVAQQHPHPATTMTPGDTICVACGLSTRARVHR